ncbi:hypothetical protein ACS5PN_03750 [Roseateles sp. NT4]|uniref:hypothetical protein n=1 Tax=Roseateles sp. NT4 TaxID=3453715 RepID=UPI003EEDCA70
MTQALRPVLPVDIPLEEGRPAPDGTVFITLPTLDALEQFWQQHRDRLPFACEGTPNSEPTFLRPYQWIFGPSKAAVVAAAMRWGRSGIGCEFYEWAALAPDDHEAWFAGQEDHRTTATAAGTWTEDDEADFQRRTRQTYRGWWRFCNLPDGQDPGEWFSPGSDHVELIDPHLPRAAVEAQLLWETFDSWVDAYPSDIQAHDAAGVDKTIAYWRAEQAAGQGYYGDENEQAPALDARH